MASFDLLKNPFVLLGVSTRDGREAITEALENRLEEGEIDEEDLHRAQQMLMASRSRLEAEMSWLVGMTPSRVKHVVAALEGKDEEAIERVLNDSNAVARGNIAASLAATSGTELNVLHHLFGAQVGIEPDYITETINADRRIAGFPKVARDLVEQALDTLKEQHCQAALAIVTGAPHPGRQMTSLVEAVLPAEGPIREFLEMVGERYDRWSGPMLRRIEDEIGVATERLRKNTEDGVALKSIKAKLDEWDEYSQARQLIYDAKGLDEPRSKAIYQNLRDLTLWLANENQCFKQALTISKALLKTFPELPTVLDQASGDIETLEGLVHEAEQLKVFGPLIAVLEKINNDVFAFAQSVDRGEFAPAQSNIAGRLYDAVAGQLYDAFTKAAKDVQGDPEHADLPWLMIRQLLIDLHNEQQETRIALKVLQGVISHWDAKPSDEVRRRLKEDQEALKRQVVFLDLMDDIGAKRWAEAITKITSLSRSSTDQQERRQLDQMLAMVERSKNAGRNKVIGWGLAAAVIIGIVVLSNQNSRPNRSPTTSITPASTTTPSTVRREEEKPPVSSNRVLSLAELRWCSFQATRLDALRPLANTDQKIDRFNMLINDLNDRCSSNKYYERDKGVIDRELIQDRSRLQREGRTLISSTSNLQGSPSVQANGPIAMGAMLLDPVNSSVHAAMVQRRLANLGYYAGTIDGIWGGESERALADFRYANSLSATPIWTRQTQTTLFAGTGL